MENPLYKVVKIQGKGLGCMALKDIEKGTLILEEKPQCVATFQNNSDGSIQVNPKSLIQSFGRMSKSDQDEYLKLYNAYNDGSVEVQDSDKRIYFLLREEAEAALDSSFGAKIEFVHEFILEQGYQGFIDVVGIYNSNSTRSGLGIKASRFNHSCCQNANCVTNEDGKIEVRAVAKIKVSIKWWFQLTETETKVWV